MTDKEIVERAKEAEKRTGFCELVHSSISKGVNSAFGIGFIEGMVEYRNSMQQYPVSEDLEEAASRYAKEEYSRKNPATLPDRCIGCYAPIMYAFKAGANWQKQKDEKNIGELQWNAHEEGWDECKQQLMAKAADAVVKIDAGGYPYVDRTIELYDYDNDIPLAKRGDKVKVIVIRED